MKKARQHVAAGGQGSGVPDHGQERHAAIGRGKAVPTTTPRPISKHGQSPDREREGIERRRQYAPRIKLGVFKPVDRCP
jgi:hypothetical protein